MPERGQNKELSFYNRSTNVGDGEHLLGRESFDAGQLREVCDGGRDQQC